MDFLKKMYACNFCGDPPFWSHIWNQHKILCITINFLFTTTNFFLRPRMDEPCICGPRHDNLSISKSYFNVALKPNLLDWRLMGFNLNIFNHSLFEKKLSPNPGLCIGIPYQSSRISSSWGILLIIRAFEPK